MKECKRECNLENISEHLFVFQSQFHNNLLISVPSAEEKESRRLDKKREWKPDDPSLTDKV